MARCRNCNLERQGCSECNPPAPLSFRDQCVLALLSNSGVGRLPMGQGEEVEIFNMADRLQAERTRREGQ